MFADSSLTGAAIAAGASYLSVVARLAPGRTIAQANDELRRITADFRRAFAGRSDTINEVEVQPLADVIVANRKRTLTLLLGAVTLVLLVSCANAAALVVSRLSGRHRELAVRQALGATRAVIVRHIMGETVVLAVIAGAVGIVLAAIALRTIDATLGSVLPPGVLLRIDTPVLAVAMLAVVVAVVLVGVIPALHATRATSATGAAAFGRGSSESAATHRFRRGLVVTEVALSSGLLVGAALFLTSLSYVQHLPVGFDLSGLAAAAVILPADTYPTPERQGAFFDDVLDRLTPKVARAAIAFGLPFAGDNFVSPYVIRGRAIPPPAARRRAGLRIVTEEYLTVMRIRLVAGRFFSAADRAGAQPVCVVNESFSRHEFGNRSPLGAVVLRGRDADQPFENRRGRRRRADQWPDRGSTGRTVPAFPAGRASQCVAAGAHQRPPRDGRSAASISRRGGGPGSGDFRLHDDGSRAGADRGAGAAARRPGHGVRRSRAAAGGDRALCGPRAIRRRAGPERSASGSRSAPDDGRSGGWC